MASNVLALVARFRRKIQDTGGDTGTPPSGYTYYWEYDDGDCFITNASLVEMLNEAQTELCRRFPIRDSFSYLSRINVLVGQDVYALDPRILAVERAYLATTDRVLTKTYAQRVDEEDARLTLDGEVRYYREDLVERYLTLIGTPTVAETLELAVARLPLEPLVWGDPLSVPEIPEYYIEDLLLYGQYLAYSNRDFDLFDAEAANVASDRFRSRVGDPRTPRDLNIANHVANARLRVRGHY